MIKKLKKIKAAGKIVPWSFSFDKLKFLDLFRETLWDGGFFSRCKHYFFDMPDALPWGGWAIWENKTRKKHPVSWFFLDTLPDFFRDHWRPIRSNYYHLKSKYYTRHHHIKIDVDRFFVNIHGSERKLNNYHWLDSDTKILYANFQILVDFVENESDIIDWSSDPQHQEAYDEFMELYKWWTEDRLNRESPHKNMKEFGLDHDDFFSNDRDEVAYKAWSRSNDEANKIEEEWEGEDTLMLIRLITIRKWLWS